MGEPQAFSLRNIFIQNCANTNQGMEDWNV